MRRTLFDEEHLLLRDAFRAFLAEHVTPYHADWEKAGIVDRAVWTEAGKQGFLGFDVPEEYGGGGQDDFRYNAVITEECGRAGTTGLGYALHNDVVAPYLIKLCTDEQKRRWLPGFCSGEIVTAIAMTEPGAGSDLRGMRTSARRDGSDWLLSGSKTFITNGIHADLVVVAARTSERNGGRGLSLFGVERGMPGFTRGRNLDKVGMKAQDTAELFFDDVRVPAANLIGEEGAGFLHLVGNLPQERLSVAVLAAASMEAVLGYTVEYCKSRKAFGQSIGSFQNSRFLLAELATETQVVRTFIDRCIEELVAGRLSSEDAAMAKWWSTELQVKLIDRCLQLHGGYGYMTEYPVARAYLDARVQTIYAGTTEIMKEIIGRGLGV
ncbi:MULTISPECIES: acyl-CoA dehydrogenase family protein [unclassified Pseudofrankia]|uniref:acyl-CoA dehydrogenase family protein n=1 Tax=unclassified Pseudofrankia TaxID=2994372 RepID=UPI0008DA30BD|nr:MULTISPECIES: acyl-CoA dehydrogenase family protein [unclassified Pseudofrankia]MDT3439673.1 acyl-CoA dehydrogenase family protein [Pseudofrankia sp. BMG5.37]OHV42810.1 acyl-CoA dehydrogenase [Pseudofrankia sp. BMG5.36]